MKRVYYHEDYVISIHAPREGGDRYKCPTVNRQDVFQSTPPVRGGDGSAVPAVFLTIISIHAPREGGDLHPYGAVPHIQISIHAPREGGDVFTDLRLNPEG